MENVQTPFTLSIVTENNVDSTSKFQVLPWIGVLSVVAYEALKLARNRMKGDKSFSKLITAENYEMLTKFLNENEKHAMASLNEFAYELMKEYVLWTEKEQKTVAELFRTYRKWFNMFEEEERTKQSTQYISKDTEIDVKQSGKDRCTLNKWKEEEMDRLDEWKEKEKNILEEWIGLEMETVADLFRKKDRLAGIIATEMFVKREGAKHEILAEYIRNEKKKILTLITEEEETLVEWQKEKEHTLDKLKAAKLEISGKHTTSEIDLKDLYHVKEPGENSSPEEKKKVKDMFDRCKQKNQDVLDPLNMLEQEMLHQLKINEQKKLDELKKKQGEMKTEWKIELKNTLAKLNTNTGN